ncbi:hypothetical protein FVE85_7224 [Porphyridium purpureum]|uniref:BAR domain-containing protein n=1 Tax=Porphyridium purpureum TaxID=35688 RepID=A0A5J4Z6F3_PORPP|nr:hypothetical protein FVE85_7224 [Porphyridium purpureum]|eukprot:POR3265..scf295_1
MMQLKKLGSALRRETEQLSSKLQAIPMDDLASFRAYMEGKDHPQLYAEDTELRTSMSDLHGALQAVAALQHAMDNQAAALRNEQESWKALGELVSVTGASNAYESAVSEDVVATQINLGAAHVVVSSHIDMFTAELGAPVREINESATGRFENVIRSQKQLYQEHKLKYLAAKKQLVSADSQQRMEQLQAEVSEHKAEWQVLSLSLQKEANELAQELVEKMSAFLSDYGMSRSQHGASLENTLCIADSDAELAKSQAASAAAAQPAQ